MKKILLIILLLMTIPATAGTAFLKGEQINGLTKICFYDYLGSSYAITVKSHELCPLTIEVN